MMMGMFRGIALASVTLAAAAAEDEDPVEILMRLRDQVMTHAGRIPNHTCVETIRRERYQSASSALQRSCDSILSFRRMNGFESTLKWMSTDRLRLDVAFTGEREIYSWAGASKFEDGEIDELVHDGPMGTGPYASMLISVFTPGVRFTFEGEKTVDGRSLLEYSYRVTEELSHYRVKTQVEPREWLITAYSGTLLLDARSGELVRATTRTAELKPETSLCETNTTLEFGVVNLGGIGYLLPKTAKQRYIGRTGFEGENTISFSACREFQAESTLMFVNGKATYVGSPSAAVTLLPPGLPVTVNVTTPIDGARAAAGDRIEGKLARPIENFQKRTLVAEGALVEGRLMRVENRHAPSEQLTLALRWESIGIGARKTPLTLRPNRRASGLNVSGPLGLKPRAEEFELPAPGEGRYATFQFPGRDVQVPAGLKTDWLTAAP